MIARALARFAGIHPDQIRRAVDHMIDEHGLIRIPALVAFFIVCAAAGCALGFMAC